MNPKRDLVIVIFLLIAIGVAWYLSGGSTKDLSGTGPFLRLPGTGTGTPAYTVPSVILNKASTQQDEPNEKETKDTVVTNYLGTLTETTSPYASYVTLERSAASSDYRNEYLTVRVRNTPQRIAVTGWRIESTATNLGTTLPQAMPLPSLGHLSSLQPVTLGAGETAYIVTGRSPLGTSFRTNMCTGYFEQFQDFVPNLRLACPSPDDEAERYFTTGTYTTECYNLVRAVNRCTLTIASIPASAGAQCQPFIESTLTYNGCATAHKNESGFYKNEWYLYLNRDQELWRDRSERIRLVDENGKVVGVVNY